MKDNLRKLLVLGIVLSGALLAGCGDDNDDESDGGAVTTSITLDPSVLGLADATIAAVQFSFSSDDVFDDDRNVALAVLLPSSLRYRNGSSEIQRPIDDRNVEPQVTFCADGSTLLVYDLDEDDLFDAENPGGNADAELRFTADAQAMAGTFSMSTVAANDSLPVACGLSFPTQQSAVFTVR